MTPLRLWLCAAVALVAAACGGGNYNQACATSADCTGGLFCPTVGPMQGHCTRSCTKDEECSSLGSNLVCTSDVCTPK